MSAGALSLVGLCLSILGTALLVVGVLKRHMTAVRSLGTLIDASWYSRIPVNIARRFGSRNVANTNPDFVGDYSSTFWGLLLLILGFAFQAVGQWCSMK